MTNPAEPLLVTADQLEFMYERTHDGDDLVGVLMVVRGEVAGSLFIALSPEQATGIATTLRGMVGNLPALRAQWDEPHQEKETDQ